MDPKHITQAVLEYRQTTDAFQQSIVIRSPAMNYTFFDGPPFTSGDPHYGHLLQSTIKDMIPRWMTMRGYRVPRVWGWDCHGIPAENFVNKSLGISSKKQIEEEVGIESYIEACRSMVNNVNENWSKVVDQLGRWVDMDNAYFTMDNAYMETVINIFSDLYHRNLIYKGFKVLGYSWALGTSLSNHEINEGYEMRQDPAVTIAFPALTVGEHDRFQTSELGAVQCVAGVIEQDGKLLQVYDTRSSVWYYPGGKVEKGETKEQALAREINEEIGVTVTTSTLLGVLHVPFRGILYELSYFSVTIDGVPTNCEPDKQGAVEWVEQIPFDNELGFALKVGDLLLDDRKQIEHDFKDYFFIKNKYYELPGLSSMIPSMLARTTTPWTLPSNMFLAVNASIWYAVVYDHEKQALFIIAQEALDRVYPDKKAYQVLFVTSGSHLVGLKYEPPFSYYHDDETIANEYKQQVHRVVHADFVTTDAGTGIAHEAPAFGEDDYNLVCTILPKDHAQDWLFDPIDDHGSFTDCAPDRSGMNVIEANKLIIAHLKQTGRLFKHETINHSYPHCPRTGTPLIYKAIQSRFVQEEDLKTQTIPAAEQMRFVPDSIKKRFINGLESAPDWNISRSRYWGCPLPVWENPDNPEERLVVGSLDEIFQYNKPAQQLTKVIFVRHGRTDYNDKKRVDCLPADKAQLNELGRQQAALLPEHFAGVQIDHIYSSPMSRCKEMIAPLAAERDCTVHYDERIQEIGNYGFQDKVFDCSTISWNDQPVDGASGESIQAVATRVEAFFQEIVAKHPGACVVICSHGDPIALMRKMIYQKDYAYAKSRLYLDNKSLEQLPVCVDYVRPETGQYVDLHRPYIDTVLLHHPETGHILQRIPEVLDCWFESGSMPFAQHHRLKSEQSDETVPVADFIAEGLDQTRGWFRALYVLGHAYVGQSVYTDTVVTGLILAEDGKKMSKRLNNFPNPLELLDQYGADPLRLYLFASPVVRAETLRFAQSGVEQMFKDVVIPLHNVWNFLSTYAAVDAWKPAESTVYFMRHAHCHHTEESPRTNETPISKLGQQQLQEQSFIEEVLRVNPDIIITSPVQRTQDTAAAVQNILDRYLGKTVEIRITDDLSRGMTEENAGDIIQRFQEQYPGQTILLVSHKKRFRMLRKVLTGYEHSVHTHEMMEQLLLENTQIVPIPLQLIHNELDQWIYAELHRVIMLVDEHLASYAIEHATKVLIGFVDSLTNWYVRRSRRRFWASGMEQDKRSAYQTLWDVLQTYLRLLAPFAPFTSEYLWQAMQMPGSVHHASWPIGSKQRINQQLLEEVECVRKIISGAMYIRAKNQIKIKQPLSSLEFSF